MNKRKFIYAVLENIVFNVIIYIMFYYMNPIKENFLYMNIHPLLIIVSFTGLRYGNYIGIFSASLASITYFSSYYLLDKDVYLFFSEYTHYKFIIMFFLSAIILGRFKDNFDYRVLKLQEEKDLLKENYDELNDGYNKLKFIKEELRKQVVGAEYSIASLYEIASSLETLDSEEIYTEIMNILSKFLKAKTVSIYTLSDNEKYLRLKLKMGEDKIIPNSIIIDNHNCYNKLIKNKTVIKGNPRCANFDNCALLMGPIIKDNKVVAIINIENMEFEMLTEYSVNLFKIIIDWINKALSLSIEYESSVTKNKYYKNTNIMKYKFFKERLKEENERRERYDLDYDILVFDTKLEIYTIDKLLKNIVRKVDVIGYDNENKSVYILLPATNKDKSKIVKERILNISNELSEKVQ